MLLELCSSSNDVVRQRTRVTDTVEYLIDANSTIHCFLPLYKEDMRNVYRYL